MRLPSKLKLRLAAAALAARGAAASITTHASVSCRGFDPWPAAGSNGSVVCDVSLSSQVPGANVQARYSDEHVASSGW